MDFFISEDYQEDLIWLPSLGAVDWSAARSLIACTNYQSQNISFMFNWWKTRRSPTQKLARSYATKKKKRSYSHK